MNTSEKISEIDQLTFVGTNNISSRETLITLYKRIRAFTEELCILLLTEDYVIQSMPDVSPTKWHLAHTTWFWEAFVLRKFDKNYKSINDQYNYLFNSYYVQVGERWTRSNRGLLSRPTVEQVYEYRHDVDKAMFNFFTETDDKDIHNMNVNINIGLNHEQQHQELMLTDIKHVFSINPLYPVYKENSTETSREIQQIKWIEFDEGVKEIGYNGNDFFYDNEKPRHKVYLNSYQLASRLVTNAEYIEFIEDGGYNEVTLWLSDGIAAVENNGWSAPLYWEKINDEWHYYTLNGFKKVNPYEPVCHVSQYEADAFAQWYGARLPTESEWENASANIKLEGNFVDNRHFHPLATKEGKGLQQMYGDLWEWTRSDYAPYPGYKIPPGAIGEYNGKFMSGQVVLRGGSCATSLNHIRNTYRNFFPPAARWQFMGIRLAKDS